MHPALGIDYGDVRIGVAATDPVGILAHPVETIQQGKGNPIERIAELVISRGIRTIVLGLPIRMDGTEGTAAEKVRKFGDLITQSLPEIPLVYVDEYLTTTMASQKLHEAGKNAKKQRQVIDQAAAVEILTIWMRETQSDDIQPDW